MIPIEGFSVRLSFERVDGPIPEGKSWDAARHPRMQAILSAMAARLRSRLDFEELLTDTMNDLIDRSNLGLDVFTDQLNKVRDVAGLPPLVSAEKSVEALIQDAVRQARSEFETSVEDRIQHRVKAALSAAAGDPSGVTPAERTAEAVEHERATTTFVPPMGQGAELHEPATPMGAPGEEVPPPPRGATAKKGNGNGR